MESVISLKNYDTLSSILVWWVAKENIYFFKLKSIGNETPFKKNLKK